MYWVERIGFDIGAVAACAVVAAVLLWCLDRFAGRP